MESDNSVVVSSVISEWWGGPRRVAVSGHQEYWEGYFHAWTGLSEHAMAVVEDHQGNIKEVECWKIKFLNPWR